MASMESIGSIYEEYDGSMMDPRYVGYTEAIFNRTSTSGVSVIQGDDSNFKLNTLKETIEELTSRLDQSEARINILSSRLDNLENWKEV